MEFCSALIAELSNPFLTRGRQRELLKERSMASKGISQLAWVRLKYPCQETSH